MMQVVAISDNRRGERSNKKKSTSVCLEIVMAEGIYSVEIRVNTVKRVAWKEDEFKTCLYNTLFAGVMRSVL